MDILKSLGELAIGSRLKRLSDVIMRDGVKIYQANGIDFQPRWFPVFYSLSQHSQLSVTEIAKKLGLTHPTVSQTLKELEKTGFVSSGQCQKDGRKRLLTLSEKGKRMLPQMELIWRDVANTIHDLLVKNHQNLLMAVEEVEVAFSQKDFFSRVQESTKARQQQDIEILPYDNSLKSYFKDLNYQWINKYFKVEDLDRMQLENPDTSIIDQGGTILFARFQGEIVGTCALIKIDDQTYELAKMAVDEKAQGKQAGKKLGLAIIKEARKRGGHKLVLESNKKLSPALNLYEKLGFKPAQEDDHESLYCRANIKMELLLENSQ